VALRCVDSNSRSVTHELRIGAGRSIVTKAVFVWVWSATKSKPAAVRPRSLELAEASGASVLRDFVISWLPDNTTSNWKALATVQGSAAVTHDEVWRGDECDNEPMGELNDRLVAELTEAVRAQLRREQNERQRDVYLIGDIEKDTARLCIERLRELSNDSSRPISLYINSAGGNVTDGLAIHDVVRHLVHRGLEVSVIVQGMAYSMGSIVLQAASEGKRLAYPHSWIMIHEPAKWAGWQSTTAAAQHLERLKQMQDQIYTILSSRSGKPLRQIIRDTKRTDFYLDAPNALEYGLVDGIVGGALPAPRPVVTDISDATGVADQSAQLNLVEPAAREQ
jgi:ATP-dependent Clp protease, protease subunit